LIAPPKSVILKLPLGSNSKSLLLERKNTKIIQKSAEIRKSTWRGN
jgi:hypothetical protein